jgi:hypothetical protein
MQVNGRAMLALVLAAGLAAGCGRSDAVPHLMNLRKTQGPDEFSILPTKPLQAPPDYTSLPPPTPGGSNLTDPTPDADAVAALGGNPAALTRGGVDGRIVSYASRYGVEPDIRASLRAADIEYRRDHPGRVLERLFGLNTYYRAYRRFQLDKYAELDRLRRAGVKTPSAPPDPALQ